MTRRAPVDGNEEDCHHRFIWGDAGKNGHEGLPEVDRISYTTQLGRYAVLKCHEPISDVVEAYVMSIMRRALQWVGASEAGYGEGHLRCEAMFGGRIGERSLVQIELKT